MTWGRGCLPWCPARHPYPTAWQYLPGTPGWKSHINMAVSINGGTPIAGWFAVENPIYKWMITGGTPILGNPNICGNSLFTLRQHKSS